MDVKSYIYRLALFATVISNVGCNSVDEYYSERNLIETEACLDMFYQDIQIAIDVPPKFQEIKDVVQWSASNIPTNMLPEIENLAVHLRGHAGIISGLSDPANRYRSLLYIQRKVAEHFSKIEPYRSLGCGDVVLEQYSNAMSVFLLLNEYPLASRFEFIGINDSYYIEQSFILMLVVEFSGIYWEADWFSDVVGMREK